MSLHRSLVSCLNHPPSSWVVAMTYNKERLHPMHWYNVQLTAINEYAMHTRRRHATMRARTGQIVQDSGRCLSGALIADIESIQVKAIARLRITIWTSVISMYRYCRAERIYCNGRPTKQPYSSNPETYWLYEHYQVWRQILQEAPRRFPSTQG